MLELDYAALAATPVATAPFPHVVVPQFVPPADLAQVVADLPAMTQRGSFPITSLRLGPAAQALMQELEGPRFRAAHRRKIRPRPRRRRRRWSPCAASPRERDGHIHCDSTAKRVTVLLYLNPDTAAWARQEGCLRLLRGPGDLDDYAVEVPPVNGTLLVFPNGPDTWHGHKHFVGRRYVVQLNYMTTDDKARYELRRHKFSAFIKRLTHALAAPGLLAPQHLVGDEAREAAGDEVPLQAGLRRTRSRTQVRNGMRPSACSA